MLPRLMAATTAAAVTVLGATSATAAPVATADVQPRTCTAPDTSSWFTVGISDYVTLGTCTPALRDDRIDFQWLRDGEPIAGATEDSYTPTTDDIAHVVSLRVTRTLAGYETVVGTSEGGRIPGLFSQVRASKLTGVGQVGKYLTFTQGSYSPTPGSIEMEWASNGYGMVRGPGNSHRVRREDAGTYITVETRVWAPDTTQKTFVSNRIGIGFYAYERPTIVGTTRVGRSLTAYRGRWTPYAHTYSYQWYRGSTKIWRATNRTYKLSRYDAGKRIKVKVIARREGHPTGTAYSFSTATIR